MASKETEVAPGTTADTTAQKVLEAVEFGQVADLFKAAGYRVTHAEQNGIVQLMSASQGVGFAVRFGNAATTPGAYLDYTLSCAMQVQGELPPELVLSWNRSKRFARLSSTAQFLLLEMDVIVAGGVTERYLSSTIELWDRLIQEFLLHLRNRPAIAQAQQQAQQQVQQSQQAPAAKRGEAPLSAEADDAGHGATLQ